MDYEHEQAINYCKNKYINRESLYDTLRYLDIPVSWFYTSVLDGCGKISYNVRKAKSFLEKH